MVATSIRAGVVALVLHCAMSAAGTPPAVLEFRGGYSILGNMLGVAGLAAGDIDGDGRVEIIVAGTTGTFGGPGLFSVLRADATAPMGYRQIAFSEVYAAALTSVALIDRNGLGAQDIVAGLGDGTLQVFEGTGLTKGSTATVVGAVNQVCWWMQTAMAPTIWSFSAATYHAARPGYACGARQSRLRRRRDGGWRRGW